MNRLTHALRTAGAGVKSFAMRFASRAVWRWSTALGRSTRDYAGSVGDGRGNAIIVACILWICRTLPESPVRAQKKTPDGWGFDDSPIEALVQRPNTFYSGELLWWATLADWMATGNAYWLKIRSGANRVVELWWVPSTMIEPKWNTEGTEYIGWYEYTPDGQVIRLDPKDVVHFRYGLDPQNIRKGLSPIGSLAREIFTDDEAANFSASLLANLGVPGVIIAPAENVTVNKDDVETIKAQFEQKFGGDNRGRALVMSARTTATVVSFNPQQMDLKTLRRLPEERVSAVIGVPAVVVGLGAGLDRSTFANFAEAREAAYESNVIPSQRLLVADLNLQLVPDFGDPANLRMVFDNSNVRVLQEDEDKRHARARNDWQSGGITMNEYRHEIGLDPLPEGDVLAIRTGVQMVAPADLLAVPEPRMQVTDVTGATPPAKFRALPGGKRVAPEKVVPLGAGEPFDPLPDRLTFTDADKAAVGALWDETFSGEPEEGLLDAAVEA